MARPRKKWNEEAAVSEDKTYDKVESVDIIENRSSIEIGEEVEPESTGKPHKVFKDDTSEQSVSTTDKKKLPKITISYYDRSGQLVVKEFTCVHLRIDQDMSTVLEGLPISRRDSLHLSIDAQVVKVN